jgi:hypothetical protein
MEKLHVSRYESKQYSLSVKYTELDALKEKGIFDNKDLGILFLNLETITKPMYLNDKYEKNPLSVAIMLINITLHYRHYFLSVHKKFRAILYTPPNPSSKEYFPALESLARVIPDIQFLGELNYPFYSSILYSLIPDDYLSRSFAIVQSSREADMRILSRMDGFCVLRDRGKMTAYDLIGLYKRFFIRDVRTDYPMEDIPYQRYKEFLTSFMIVFGHLTRRTGILGKLRGASSLVRYKVITDLLRDMTKKPKDVPFCVCDKNKEYNIYESEMMAVGSVLFQAKGIAVRLFKALVNTKVECTTLDNLHQTIDKGEKDIELKVSWAMEKA